MSPSSFEAGDGNMTVDTNGNADWNCFANGKATGFPASGVTVGGTCNSNLVYANALQVTADSNGEVSWVNGQKFDTACPALAVNNNPPKDEFTHVASYNETDPTTKDLFFYGATIRPNTNGNSTGNVEFDQKAGNGTTTAGCRTAGDRLIAYDFLNGGTSLDFHVLTWITNQTPGVTDQLGGNNGKCFVKTDSDAFNTTTQTGGCWGANVITESNNDLSTFEGGVNTGVSPNVGTIDAAHNGISGSTGGESVPALAFAEFGINVSKAFGTEGQCTSFAQVQWESRSSGSSFSSNPQDIETEGKTVTNCGEVIIKKHTDPRGTNKSFSYTSDMTGSPSCSLASPNTATSFSLNDNGNTTGDSAANTQDCTSVPSGTVHVTETLPSGWTLESLTCDSSNGVQDGSNPLKADITVSGGATVTCTYTNKQNTAKLTTQQGTATGTVFPGTSVTDTATVTGSTSTYPDSSVPVKFFLCGPEAALTSCASGDSTRKAVTPDGTLSPTATAGESTATSAAVNTSGSPLAAGTYCFGATWAGDATYPGALSDDGTNECFAVSQIATTTTTTPSPSGGTTTFGDTTVTDHAVVEAVSDGGGIPTGTVTFTICSPSQMAALTESTCATGGTPVGGAVTLGSVDQNLAHPSAAADSSAFTNGGNGVNQVGTWCWRAVYSPSGANGNNYTGSHDSSVGECFTVTDTTNSTSAQIWYPNDSGSVSAAGGENITGTLTLQLYTGGTCQDGNQVSGQSYTSGDQTKATITVDSKTAGVPQTSYGVSANATVSWKVVFASDNTALIKSSSHCESSSIANLQN